jgi:hypothetical protein
MLALPPVAPVVGWRRSERLPRDHYVRIDSNDYSVHPSAVGPHRPPHELDCLVAGEIGDVSQPDH